MLARCMPVAYPCRAPSCVPVRVPQSVFRVFLGSGSCCLPLQMRSAPRGGGGKAAAGWKKLGKAYGRRVKIEKIRKSRKKTGKKFGNPAKSITFAVPFGKGASVPPPRIGGSSLNRKKEARAGPAEPAPSGRGFFVPGRCKERRRKSELYNEEFDPGSG